MQVRHRIIPFLSALAAVLAVLVLGGGAARGENGGEWVDYASAVPLDFSSETVKTEASVRCYVDGDTTHFSVSGEAFPSGVLKARYLGINTPESTGRVEPYGKQAAEFTRQKLSGASKILIESDDGAWNRDSTGTRHLVWVWYSPDGEAWRCLNIELLQEGLAIANASARNRYGETCVAAINQAKARGRKLYSGEKDPEFYYGDAVEVTLRELRINTGSYEGIKVAFQGVVTVNSNYSVYVEAFDGESGMSFGIPVYYGYSLSGGGLEILRPGNEVRIVGTPPYYEAGDVWQVSGITYRMMKPDDPGNIRLISGVHPIPWTPTDAGTLMEGTVSVALEEENAEFDYAALAQATTVTVSPVSVQTGYSSGGGRLTLACVSGGTVLRPRLDGALNGAGEPFTLEELKGKTVSVRGIVGRYQGEYRIEVLTPDGVTILQ